MPSQRIGLWFLLVALPLATPLAAAPPNLSEQPAVVDAVRLLDVWVEEQRAHQQLPGVAIGVVHAQELVWAKGYGVRDLASTAAMTPSTVFRVGSATKLFTATAILQLRDRGKLRLDDPVSEHLPWFSVQNTFEGEPAITVRHLLTHTSGLSREAAFPYWTTHEFPTRDELRAAIPQQSAIFAPATRYKYSNLGIALLGEIVSEISGLEFAEYLARHIFAPLGMTRSSASPSEDLHRMMTIGYLRRLADGSRGIADYYDTGALAPAANIVSTIEDLARFAVLQLSRGPRAEGAQILRGSTLREMQRPHWVRDNWQSGRGLGFQVSRRGDKTIVSHGGWVAGHRTHFLLLPSADLAVIAMTNADDGNPSAFSTQALDLVGAAIRRVLTPPPTPKVADPGWQRFLGEYTDPWGWEYKVLILGGELVMYDHGYPPADDAEDGITTLTPVTDNTFRMSDGETVVFELSEEGTVERVRRRYDYLYPIVKEQ